MGKWNFFDGISAIISFLMCGYMQYSIVKKRRNRSTIFRIFMILFEFLLLLCCLFPVRMLLMELVCIRVGEGKSGLKMVLIDLIVPFLFLYLSVVFKGIFLDGKNKMKKRELLFMGSVLSVTGAFICIFVKMRLTAKEMEQAGSLFLLSFFYLVIANFFVWFLICNQNRLILLQKENELLFQEIEFCRKYQKKVQSSDREIIRVKQEIGEMFQKLYCLIKKEEISLAMKLIREKKEILEEVSSFVNTRNIVANAAINGCFSRAARHHIKIISMLPEDFYGIDDYDLSSLLTNMLDNAIEGCLQIPQDKGRILFLEITKREQIYIFRVENTMAGQGKKRNPSLSTTKKEKSSHGYGTGIIREIAGKYHGNAEFYVRENVFCCRVVLYGKSIV